MGAAWPLKVELVRCIVARMEDGGVSPTPGVSIHIALWCKDPT